MEQRELPAPDVYATCPRDGNVLQYYAGVFDAVFVSLHPFIRARSIELDRFTPESYPDRTTIVNNCTGIRWSEVIKKTGLPSIAAIDIGLRTRIGGLKPEFSNEDYAKRLDALTVSDGIICPDEGEFSDILYEDVLSGIQALGYRWVWVGDEFCTERKLHWIDDLRSPASNATTGHKNVFTPDKRLLWTTHWDSHFSFLCSSRANLFGIQQNRRLEGFFCAPETEVYWSVRSSGSSIES